MQEKSAWESMGGKKNEGEVRKGKGGKEGGRKQGRGRKENIWFGSHLFLNSWQYKGEGFILVKCIMQPGSANKLSL